MANPSKDIKSVMDMIVMLLTGNLNPNWTQSRKLLGDYHILQKLKYFDKDNISRQVILSCRELIKTNALSEERINKVSKAATVLFRWASALVCIYHAP